MVEQYLINNGFKQANAEDSQPIKRKKVSIFEYPKRDTRSFDNKYVRVTGLHKTKERQQRTDSIGNSGEKTKDREHRTGITRQTAQDREHRTGITGQKTKDIEHRRAAQDRQQRTENTEQSSQDRQQRTENTGEAAQEAVRIM